MTPRAPTLAEGDRKILRALVLEFRHLLEGEWRAGRWIPGDLQLRLRAIGVREDGSLRPAEELPHLPPHDLSARGVVQAWLALRQDSGASGADAVDGDRADVPVADAVAKVLELIAR